MAAIQWHVVSGALTLALATGCAAGMPIDGHDATSGAGGSGGAGGGSSSGPAATGGSGGAPSSTSAGGAGSAGSGGAPATGGTLGIVVIDVQQTFVEGSSTADMSGILARTKDTFELASQHGVPFFLTFEASMSGGHALDAGLQSSVPANAQEFVKTTFDATHQPMFAQAVQGAGLTHLVVLGSETDVCVLQTVLGLRALGFTVLLQHDAVFSSEPNASPAFRRMAQAGAAFVQAADVADHAAHPEHLPPGTSAPVKIVAPLHLGVVLNDFTDATAAGGNDALATQKRARMRQLLLVSEWFSLPVYVAHVNQGLPSGYASYFQGSLRPMSQIGQDTDVTQLVFAGTDGGIASLVTSWMGSHDVFVMEDALFALGSDAAQAQALAPLYASGAVPTTYKSFWYDMTKSVDVAGWPSQAWKDRYDEYYPITKAPEDLPPMPATD